ncbi:hypothetical protein CCP3SC5AM1_2680003 [Gammaproteobacteria bacterium]
MKNNIMVMLLISLGFLYPIPNITYGTNLHGYDDCSIPLATSSCCCFIQTHIHDLVNIFPSGSSLKIQYKAGTPGGYCQQSYGYFYVSIDQQSWDMIGTVTIPERQSNDVLHTENYNPAMLFRYVKVYIPTCYNDWSSAEALYNNTPPSITSFTATPKSGNPPLTVNFNVVAKDPDGSIASYQWDFDGNGRVDRTTTIGNTTYIYRNIGTFNVKVTIVDNKGDKTISTVIPIKVAHGPDLVGKVETYDFSDTTNTIHVDFKVTNNGNIATPAFKVRFHLSNNGTILLPAFKEIDVSQGLGVGVSTVLSVDNTFSDSIYGKYVFVIVDPIKQVAEVDETNNGTKIVIQPVATK